VGAGGARSVVPLPPPFEHRRSFVDVGVARRDGSPIVVEVDRSDRKRTLDKLAAEAEQGRVALWLRWGTGTFATPPASVRLVPCRVEARKAAGGRKVFSTPVQEKPAPRHSSVDLADAEQTDLFEAGAGQTDLFEAGAGQTDRSGSGAGQTDRSGSGAGQTDPFKAGTG
jgi:hypothetical protein